MQMKWKKIVLVLAKPFRILLLVSRCSLYQSEWLHLDVDSIGRTINFNLSPPHSSKVANLFPIKILNDVKGGKCLSS